MELKKIDVAHFEMEKSTLYPLLEKIWKNPSSLSNVKHSIDRWGDSNNESGTYFYILHNGEIIGITGYYIPSITTGDFGLRHHGVTRKGTGKEAFDLLCTHLRNQYGNKFRRLIELIPPGREDLITIFKKWGFELTNEPIPAWEPKRDYYQHMMIWNEK